MTKIISLDNKYSLRTNNSEEWSKIFLIDNNKWKIISPYGCDVCRGSGCSECTPRF